MIPQPNRIFDPDRQTGSGERRWYIRYTANPGLFVVLRRPLGYKLWRSRKVAAPIVDISLKGVSIQSSSHKKWLILKVQDIDNPSLTVKKLRTSITLQYF